MRLFFVAVVLSAAPALAQSLPGQQVSRLALLAGEAPGLSLPAPAPSRPSLEPSAEDPFAPVYRRMVSLQLQLLELQQVSLAGPLTVTLIGGTAFLVGVTSLLLGFASYGFFVVGLVVLAGSSLPLLIGIPWLVGTTSANARLSAVIEKLKLEQRQLGSGSARRTEPAGGAVLLGF